MRRTAVGHRAIFWGAFAAAWALIAVLAVLGLRPTAPPTIAPQPAPGSAEARAGRMIIDGGGVECQQILFDNDSGYITDARMVRCGRRRITVPEDSGNPGGFLGSMRKSLKGAAAVEP